ncbi:MAG: hypothetical protein R2691_05050 [Solirubrobacterales bacterium]
MIAVIDRSPLGPEAAKDARGHVGPVGRAVAKGAEAGDRAAKRVKEPMAGRAQVGVLLDPATLGPAELPIDVGGTGAPQPNGARA